MKAIKVREFILLIFIIDIVSSNHSGDDQNYHQAREILNWMIRNETPLSPLELHNSLERESKDNSIFLLHEFLIEQKKLPEGIESIFQVEEKLFELGIFDLIRKEIYPIPGLEELNLGFKSDNPSLQLRKNLKRLKKWVSELNLEITNVSNYNRAFLAPIMHQLKRLEKSTQQDLEGWSERVQSILIHLNRLIFTLTTNQRLLIQEKIQYHPNHSENQKPIDWYLKRALNRLRYSPEPSLQAHLYQFNEQSVLNMILEISAEIGPEKIQIILEDAYLSNDKRDPSYRKTFERLREANIEVRTDTYANHSGSGESHNKFIIINDDWLWTGSTNITNRGFRKNFNHSLEFYSLDLNKAFSIEFEQLWEGRFQSKKWNGPMPSEIHVDSTRIEVLFSPQHFIEEKLRKSLLQAKSSIIVGMFYLTNSILLEILSLQKEKGINVHVMVDDLSLGARLSHQGNRKMKLRDFLTTRKIPYRSDGTRNLFHHKFAVIDGDLAENASVISGSLNWTSGAVKKNDENILIIHDQNLAQKFLQTFRKSYGKDPFSGRESQISKPDKPPKLKILRRSDQDLLISIEPFDTGNYISHGNLLFHQLNWVGEKRFYKIGNFFKSARHGSIILKHPQKGVLDAFLYSGRNNKAGKRVLKEWRMLSILGEWEQCGKEIPDKSCTFNLQNPKPNFCLERLTDMNRVVDWKNCEKESRDDGGRISSHVN